MNYILVTSRIIRKSTKKEILTLLEEGLAQAQYPSHCEEAFLRVGPGTLFTWERFVCSLMGTPVEYETSGCSLMRTLKRDPPGAACANGITSNGAFIPPISLTKPEPNPKNIIIHNLERIVH